MLSKTIPQGLVVFFLLCPFFILLSHFQATTSWNTDEFFWALKNSMWQGFWSALISSAGGLWLAFGLIFSENRFSKWINFNVFFLLPNFLPNLFVLIGLMNLIDPFPMGSVGVVIVHAFINFGLCGVIIKETLKSKLSKLSDVSIVLNVSWWSFFRRVMWPLVRKDLLQVFFLVFVVSFSGFAVPLVVGGGRGINLEILIFEKIKLYNDWGAAVALSAIQSSVLFLFSLVNLKSQTNLDLSSHLQSRFLESRLSFYVFAFLYCLFFYSYFSGVWEGVGSWSEFELYTEEVINGVFGTLVIAIGVGIAVMMLLFFIVRWHENNWFHRFLNGYTAPSVALIGFSFLIIAPNTLALSFFKIILGLGISYLIYLYKMGFGNFLLDIGKYKEKASLLGAGENQIFWRILFPLTYKRVFLCSGIAAFWACGDYGVSKIIASGDISLALLSETFLAQYRIGFSSLLSFILLAIGIFVFFFFIGVQGVVGRRIDY